LKIHINIPHFTWIHVNLRIMTWKHVSCPALYIISILKIFYEMRVHSFFKRNNRNFFNFVHWTVATSRKVRQFQPRKSANFYSLPCEFFKFTVEHISCIYLVLSLNLIIDLTHFLFTEEPDQSSPAGLSACHCQRARTLRWRLLLHILDVLPVEILVSGVLGDIYVN